MVVPPFETNTRFKMSIVEAWYWQNNEPIDDDATADNIARTFSYMASRRLNNAGFTCNCVPGQTIVLLGQHSIYINIKKWKYMQCYYGFPGSYLKIKVPRSALLGHFGHLRDEYAAIMKMVAALPQPIAEEVAPQITLMWKVERALG